MKIHVSELEGRALDWAVGNATGVEMFTDGGGVIRHGELAKPWAPSTDWAQCGPLIDKYVRILYRGDDGMVSGISLCGKAKNIVGPDHLVTACRIIVAAKLGEEVEIPDELVG